MHDHKVYSTWNFNFNKTIYKTCRGFHTGENLGRSDQIVHCKYNSINLSRHNQVSIPICTQPTAWPRFQHSYYHWAASFVALSISLYLQLFNVQLIISASYVYSNVIMNRPMQIRNIKQLQIRNLTQRI